MTHLPQDMGGATRLPPVSSQLYRSVSALLEKAPEKEAEKAAEPAVPLPPQPTAEASQPTSERLNLRKICDQLYDQDAAGQFICRPDTDLESVPKPMQRG